MPSAKLGKLSRASPTLPFVLLACSSLSFAQFSVTTHHYDTSRTGWNSQESVLTPANVGSSSFGLLHTVTLDQKVNAQPLVVPNVKNIAGGLHTVVYVATEGNTVYAIGAKTGAVLLSRNFGTPVPEPFGCKNSVEVGIDSTPVIDLAASIMYAVVYKQTKSGPAYYIHALDLATLADKVPPRLITASHTLSNGSVATFNAAVQRQRPGLLLANGNVYAGFGSFCDMGVNESRGWLLGWQTGTLTPLAANQILDTQASSPNNYFLSSIWMSGSGLAADYAGNILFVTGNSDPSGTTYDGITDIQESVVKVSPDLSTVLDLFTPDNQPDLDKHDGDFGSGGVMLLPDQPGSLPHLAVAAGKDGNMYLMDEDSLGGHSATTNNVLGTYPIGGCWCGASYFEDPKDGLARVVSSGGYTAMVWKLATSPSPSLSLVTSSAALGLPKVSFFTSVSSNGTANPIIWSLSLGTGVDPPVYLSAFDPETGSTSQTMNQLFNGTAGNWNSTSRAFLVPVVANGKVFVATYAQLAIFGLK
jgi:hypothetical protein